MKHIEIKDVYGIDKVLEEQGIERDSFFKIMAQLKITDRKDEFKFLEYLSDMSKDEMDRVAEALVHLKKVAKNKA